MTYDAIIIGAGAAGTYCAIHAANRGLRVLLLDHNPELGAKIRVSGGGRCNFTNTGARADTYYSHNPHFPRAALARHRPQDVLDWFGARGITWHEKHLGQIFADQRSRGILAALHDALADSGATLHTATTLHEHRHDGSHYHLRTSRGDYRSPRLVIACGAPSYPKLGATDLALRIAKQHHIANYPYRPALVPLTLAEPPAALAGISHEVIIHCDGAPSFRDQLLYTHRGISGPAVLQISTWWQRGAAITLNHLPDLPADALVAAGAFPDRSAAFVNALHPSGPYYVHHWAPDPVEAVRCVREAGGAPVLAHPRARKRQRLLPEETIAQMAQAGLFGIERNHRDHAPEDRADVDRIARELGLAEFGSSDYHGTGKPNRIGENTTDLDIIAEVIAQGSIEVVQP